MSKKTKNKETTAAIHPNKKSGTSRSWLMRLILGLAVVIIYGQSVSFNFTYDDDIFFLKHASVQKGVAGLPEFFSNGSMNKFDGSVGVQPYRPVLLLSFAIQKELFYSAADPIDSNDEEQLKELAFRSHLISILLYLLIAQFLFSLLLRLFPSASPQVNMIIALLFVVHPIHTEVVASVKSQDELLAALFGILAWYFFANPNEKETNGAMTLLAGGFFYFLSLFSKESAIAFLAIIPLSSYMVQRGNLKKSFIQLVPLVLVTGLFLYLRSIALGPGKGAEMTKLDNIVIAANGLGEQLATKAMILFQYLKLTILPWPLRYDYSFNQIPVAAWASPEAIAGVVAYLALFVLAIWNFKKRPLLSFGVLFFFIASAPTNNLFFLNGATVAERFLFVPSLSFCLLVVALLGGFAGNGTRRFITEKNGLLFIGLLVGAFALLSFSRTSVWKTELSLFERGAQESPNSSRANYNLASLYMKLSPKQETAEEKADYLKKAKEYFIKGLAIYPENTEANYNLSICYEMMGDYKASTDQYKKAIFFAPKDVRPPTRLGDLYFKINEQDSAKKYFELAFSLDSNNRISRQKMEMIYCEKGLAFNRAGTNDSAIYYLEKGLRFNPNNEITLLNLAKINQAMGRNAEAVNYVNAALKANSGNIKSIEYAGRLYIVLKDYPKAIEIANIGLRLDPNNKVCLGVLLDAYNSTGNTGEALRIRNLLNK